MALDGCVFEDQSATGVGEELQVAIPDFSRASVMYLPCEKI